MIEKELMMVEKEVITGIFCDLCGSDCRITSIPQCENFSYGVLNFEGGYPSEHDLEKIQIVFCEGCIEKLANTIGKKFEPFISW